VLDALGQHAGVSAQMVGTWDTDRMPVSEVQQMGDRFEEMLEDAHALPGGTDEIEEVNAALVSGLELMVRAYDQYSMGMNSGRFELMERGDNLILQARAQFLDARPEFDQVVGGPEGDFAEQLRDVSDELRAASLEANKGLEANADLADALENGNWKSAGQEAARAKTHFGRAVASLETLSVPTDEHVRAFLRQTANGYRLLLNAQSDYARGIAARNIAALRDGDRKVRRGYRLVTDASADLAAFAQSQVE
jgi:hypothetical protein